MHIVPNQGIVGQPPATSVAEACEAVTALIAAGQTKVAWQHLQHLEQSHPQFAVIYRLQGHLLHQAGQTKQALAAFQRAATLDPADSQANFGVALCLQAQGELPQALTHFREALRCQCQQPKHANTPPAPAPFDHHAAETILWQVLAQLAAAGVHAFATSGTLLGLVREGRLLPFDKDLDIGLPFEQMAAATACLRTAGWQQKINIHGLVNPQEWQGHGVALDLCGFLPDPVSGKVISGFWFQSQEHPWSRVTEFPDLSLQRVEGPSGKVWQLTNPEAILVSFYGEDWRVPDPEFDTVIAAKNMRGLTLVTQCYAFARIYSSWVLGRLAKAGALVRHTLRYLPDDALLHEAARLIAHTPVPEADAQ